MGIAYRGINNKKACKLAGFLHKKSAMMKTVSIYLMESKACVHEKNML